MTEKQETQQPALLSRAEVARQLGISKPTVQRLERAGLLPPVLQDVNRSYWAAADVERLKAGRLGGAQ